MKTDTYTKGVLTIIAICLIIIVINQSGIGAKAYASDTSAKGINALSNLNFATVPINDDGSINVRFAPNSEIDVNITGVSTTDELEVEVVDFDVNDEIDINIDEIGGSSVSMGGPLPVRIKN